MRCIFVIIDDTFSMLRKRSTDREVYRNVAMNDTSESAGQHHFLTLSLSRAGWGRGGIEWRQGGEPEEVVTV